MRNRKEKTKATKVTRRINYRNNILHVDIHGNHGSSVGITKMRDDPLGIDPSTVKVNVR